MDSASTFDIICNANLLHGIHKAPRPIRMECNAGKVVLQPLGDLGNSRNPVWFNPHGAANLMSLNNVEQHYCIMSSWFQYYLPTCRSGIEELCPWFPFLNCYIPDIECYIHAIKDHTQRA